MNRFLLRKEGVNLHTTAEFEIVKAIKEKECYLAASPFKDEDTEKRIYKLPDGSSLDVSHKNLNDRDRRQYFTQIVKFPP